MGALVAIAAAGVAVSAGSAIAGAAGGGGSGSAGQAGGTYGGSPSTYIPTNQPGADTNLQALESNLYGQDLTNQNNLTQQYQQQTSQLLNNPYAASAQDSANQIAGLGTGVANGAFAGATQLQGLGNMASPYASQILQTGFDPQNALYNRTQSQLTDQVNAQNAMSGLSGSPYGAGVANQAASNFNIDWQNNQLQRESTAAQGYGSLVNTAGQAYSGAQGLGAQGLNTLQTTGQLPYQTYQNQGANNLAALNSQAAGITAAQQPTQNLINNYNSYLGLGQSATGQALQGQQQAFNQSQQSGNALGQGLAGLSSGLGGLSNLFGGGSQTFSDTNTPTVPNYTNPYGAASYPTLTG